MKTVLCLRNQKDRELPEEFGSDDVRYTSELVEHFLLEFTQEEDVVLDPFMGFGTTLLAAEKLNRIAYGLEYDERRAAYVKSILKFPDRALHGDSRKLDQITLPEIDFSITSPPYMGRTHKENPFTAYTSQISSYEDYLNEIRNIYAQVAKRMKPSAKAVIEVSNLKHEDGSLTTLAWDIAQALSDVFVFKGEVIISWDPTYAYGYEHSYCLIFGTS